MRAADLKEAEAIVASLAWIKQHRELVVVTPPSAVGAVNVERPGRDPARVPATGLSLTKAAGEAALKVLHAEWDAREAGLRRRAAQIGLAL